MDSLCTWNQIFCALTSTSLCNLTLGLSRVPGYPSPPCSLISCSVHQIICLQDFTLPLCPLCSISLHLVHSSAFALSRSPRAPSPTTPSKGGPAPPTLFPSNKLLVHTGRIVPHGCLGNVTYFAVLSGSAPVLHHQRKWVFLHQAENPSVFPPVTSRSLELSAVGICMMSA